MFTTDLVNLYTRNIFKTSLYIYIFQDEKCHLMRNLSLSMSVSLIKYNYPIFYVDFHQCENPYKESYESLKKCSRCVKKLFTINLFYYMMTQTIIDIIYSVWNWWDQILQGLKADVSPDSLQYSFFTFFTHLEAKQSDALFFLHFFQISVLNSKLHINSYHWKLWFIWSTVLTFKQLGQVIQYT